MSDYAEIMADSQKSTPTAKPVLDALTIERYFCLAILPERTDVAARVLKRFSSYCADNNKYLADLGIG